MGKQRLPVVYESVLAKKYKAGRVTVARNMNHLIASQMDVFMSPADDDFNGKHAALKHVIAEIGQCCQLAAAAKEFDRPILGMQGVAKKLGLPPPSICADEAWTKISTLDLCTSHCGSAPIRFFGYEPPSAEGFSVGYYVDKDNIQFSITHYQQEEAAAFAKELRATLSLLKKIVDNS